MNHSFSKAPTADIPRSSFDRSHGLKTTLDAGKLVPIFVDEVLPGDTVSLNPTLFARVNTLLYPIMDNMFLDVHFFFVPYRQVWDNWKKFCGEQVDPGDSTDYVIPKVNTQNYTWQEHSLGDYFGLPTKVTGVASSELPFRAYYHIYNEWYRDQNLIDSKDFNKGDSASSYSNWQVLNRGKRHDYFTSCLPWPQKGDSVELPLGGQAPVSGLGVTGTSSTNYSSTYYDSVGTNMQYYPVNDTTTDNFVVKMQNSGQPASSTNLPQVYADLSQATAATINDLRRSFQIQKLLERDARSGTRYSELVNAHFGVNFMDVTYRPEYLGGTSSPLHTEAIPMTANFSPSSPVTPQQSTGDLAAMGTITCQGGGFTKSFTEHGVVMGIASVRADLTYQQGLNRMWSRTTKYDFYWPALAHIGEQAVLNKEIYYATSAKDNVFGYQERWSEYRYKPSQITGKMRSNATGSLDAWHLSQEFSSLPQLNQAFIEENPPVDRVVAVQNEPNFHMDCYFKYTCARPMPMYSVPGLIDHF